MLFRAGKSRRPRDLVESDDCVVGYITYRRRRRSEWMDIQDSGNTDYTPLYNSCRGNTPYAEYRIVSIYSHDARSVLVCNGINRLSPVACPNTSTKPSSNTLCLIIIINVPLLSLYFFRPSPSILIPPKTWSLQPHLLVWAWAPSRKRSGSALSFPFPSRSSVLVRDRGYDHVRSLAPCRPLVAHRRAGRRSRNRSRMSLMRTRHSTRLLPWVGGRCSILWNSSARGPHCPPRPRPTAPLGRWIG